MVSVSDLLHDGPAVRAHRSCGCQSLLRNRGQGRTGRISRSTPSIENSLLVLLDQRVLRLGEDLDHRVLGQLAQRGDHRQAAHQFRDQAELDQVLGLDLAEHLADACARTWLLTLTRRSRCPISRSGSAITFSRPSNAPPQMNRMLVVSIWRKSWFGCLRPPLGRNAEAIVPSTSLSKRLLHALARDVARDADGLSALRADLVDLVDVDDPSLGPVDVVVAVLQQLLDDVLDILAHIPGFGQRRGVGDHERHVQQAGRASARAASCRSRSGQSEGCCSWTARLRRFLALPAMCLRRL